MANEKNLIPLSKRTKSEQRKIATMGGVASGKARREKKTMREVAKMMLDLQNHNPDSAILLEEMGVDREEQTNRASVIAKLLDNVNTKGDPVSAKILMQTAQEFSEQQEVDLTTKDSVFIKGFAMPPDEELENIEDEQ